MGFKLQFVSSRGSPRERLIRALALVGVVMVVVWAFWKTSEQTMQQLNARQSIYDQTGEMTRDDMEFVQGFATSLESEFGLRFRLYATNESIKAPELDSKTIFMGLCPPRGEVVVYFPALLERAVGPGFTEYIRESHFPEFFKNGEWIQGLKQCLALIWERLVSLERSGKPKEGG